MESPSQTDLTQQMRSLLIRISKGINHFLDRRGAIFEGRYHLHALKGPKETRNAMKYVLTNDGKHKNAPSLLTRFSSAILFFKNKEKRQLLLGRSWFLDIEKSLNIESEYAFAEKIVGDPSTWMLRLGWMRAA